MVTIGGIPVYDALITDEETGMMKISLVDDPAVMSDFLAFDNIRKMQMYSVTDDEKRLVRGVVMRADFPIYRRDERMGEYYIIYKPETIRKMAEKYLAESRQNILNAMHRGEDLPDIYMVQYFIKGDGVSVTGFDDIADGSLFAEFHILNDEVWEAVKKGDYKGFSLEGFFDLAPERDKATVEEIVDDLDGQFCLAYRNFILNCKNMSKINRFKAALSKLLAVFGNVTTDKGVLAWDGDEDLKEGDAVFIEDQEGNRTDAPDGDYITSDNKTIVVVDGKVSEIKDPEAEVAPEDAPAEEENKGASEEFRKVAVEHQETYNDKMNAIADAIRQLGFMDFYIQEAGDEYAIACVWTPEGEVYYKFIIREWNEDGSVSLENGEKVVPAFVAPEEKKEAEEEEAPAPAPAEEPAPDAEEELRKENAELRSQVESLTKKVEELSKMPLAEPAHEEVKASATVQKTGVKGLDRLAELMRK